MTEIFGHVKGDTLACRGLCCRWGVVGFSCAKAWGRNSIDGRRQMSESFPILLRFKIVGGRGAFLFSGFRQGARFNRATYRILLIVRVYDLFMCSDTVNRIFILDTKKPPYTG